MDKFFTCLALVFCLTVAPAAAEAKYIYLHSEGEYSVELPDAPSAVTIWGGDKNIPYLDNPAKFGPLGERASVTQVDPQTGDIFKVEITFLKANRDYLLSLTPDHILDMIYADYKDTPLDDMKPGYTAGSDTLKWGTLTGYSTSKNNKTVFNATHFLAGLQTIMVIHVEYNIQNPAFNDAYKKLSASIRYNQP